MSRLQTLQKFIQNERLMTLATSDTHVWSTNIYFVADEDLTFYFVSNKHSKHAVQISSNPWVSFGIAWFDPEKPLKNRKSVQCSGICGELEKKEDISKALELYKKVFPDYTLDVDDFIGKEDEQRMFKIQPDLIKYLDDEAFGVNGFEEFNFMKNRKEG